MRNRRQSVLCALLVPVLGVLGCDCGDGDDTGADGGGTGADGSVLVDGRIVAQDGDVVVTEDGGFSFVCHPTVCDGHLTECGDCVDNDGDGRVDYRDQECLGPCDNTEGPQLTTGVGGEGGTSCNRDCYFDFGNGSGNDNCRWDTLCDPNEPDPICPFEMGELGGMRCPATQVELCLDYCRPITPNGCDCFGCCTFDELAGRAPGDGGEWVWLGSGVGEGPDGEGTCTFELLGDTTACKPCEPVADCTNGCGACELCLGRTELPASCYEMDGGVEYRCDEGVQPCGLPGEAECQSGYYCITGCCVVAPI